MANKPIRIPVELLDNAVESGIFCLPLAGRDVLLSIADRLLWDIYVDASGNKVILDDRQMAVIEETIEGLLMGCEFPDYSNELAALAEAIASIQISSTCAPNITVSCGDSSFITIPGPGAPPVINPGPLPDVPIDTDNPVPLPDDYPSVPLNPEVDAPPFDYQDWGAYDVAACEAANAAVDFGYQLLRAIRDFVTQDLVLLAWLVVAINAVLTGGIALLFSSAFVIKLAEIAYKLITRWEITVTIEFLDDMIAFIEENRQDMVCDLYESRTGGLSGVNSMLARVLNFAAGLEYAQAEFSTVQELVTMILPPGLFFAALAGAVDYENANFVECGACEYQRFIAVTIPDEIFNTAMASFVTSRVSMEYSGGVFKVTKTQDSANYAGTVSSIGKIDFASVVSHYGGGSIVAACFEVTEKQAIEDGRTRWASVPFVNAGEIYPGSMPVGFATPRFDAAHNTQELSEFLVQRFGSIGQTANSPGWSYGYFTMHEAAGDSISTSLWLVIDMGAA